jgi:hypothetical protein
VNELGRSWHRPALRAAGLALALLAAPVVTLAEPAGGGAPPGAGLRASVEKMAATEALAPERAPATLAARAATTESTDLGSKSFFRTPAGIVTLVAVGVGAGYAIYSASHDRVHSPAR